MWKVVRKCEFGLIGEDEFRSWEGAKEEFRYIINEKLGAEGIAKFTEQIDGYCKEFYPDSAPQSFEQLKTILTKLVTEPEYPQNPDDLELEDFEDDNIEFYMSDTKKVFIYNNNEDVIDKFPSAEINVVMIDDPEDEYYFFITDNRSPMGGKHYSTDITLMPADED